MKLTILTLSGVLLLATQVNAQQQPSVSVNVNPKVNTNVSTSSSYSYTVNDVKNSVNVRYGSNSDNQDVQDDSPVKSKSFSKAFSLDRNDKINLSNQFGNMTIKTWPKNEIKVDVDIKAYAKTDEEAQKLLDDVSINATKSGDLVTYKTNIGERNGNWGRSIKNGKTIWRREVKVHYTVYMPSSNSLAAAQTYGNITMDNFSGPTSIKVQYGDLAAGDLINANNYVNIQYGKANIKDVNKANIKLQYGGGLTLTNINELELDAQYTSVKIGSVMTNANIKHQYGSGVTIGYAGSLTANMQYANVKVDKLAGIFTGKFQYGKLDINSIEPSCKVLNVDGDYSSISLGFASSFNGDFSVNTNYGGFKYGTNVTAKKLGDEKGYSSSKSYSGQIGKGGTANVNIKTDYGSVTFK